MVNDEVLRDREGTILAVVRDVLKQSDIEPEDNFFAVGGDSLIALQVITGAAERGLNLDIVDVLTAETLSELAQLASPMVPGSVGSLAASTDSFNPVLELPEGASGIRPASALQIGMIFLSEMAGPGTGIYLDFSGVRVTGALDSAALEMALDRVVQRHEALRSYFDLGNHPVAAQVVLSAVRVSPELTTLDSGEDPGSVIARWRARVVESGIDTSVAPPVRCHVVAAVDHFWLSLATHHSILDGWSFSRLMVDLLLHYDAAIASKVAALPRVPPGGAAAFVRLEQAALASPEAERFWKEQARRAGTHGSRSEVVNASSRVPLALSADVWAGLKRTAAGLRVPVKSLCLAAHAQAVGRWRGQPEVVTGLVTNGRPEIEGADRLVGLFLNTVPIVLPAVGQWGDRARSALRAERVMSPYRRYPFASMTSASGGPLFDIIFNFTHFHVVRELDQLETVAVDSWWDEGLATFPVLVDVFAENPMLGTGARISYDPTLLREDEIRDLAAELESALLEASRLQVGSSSG